MTYDPDNIFAKILRGEIPCNKVFESDHTLAFSDIAPQAPTHILVIPKGSYIDIADFSANASIEEQTDFLKSVSDIVKEHNLTDNGFRSIANTGDHGGQEVPHFHLHLLAGKKLGPMLAQ